MAKTEVTGKQIKDSSVDLTVDVTGVLPVANGGSGSNTIALNNVVLGNGTGALQTVAPGTSGNVLTSNGTTWLSSAPTSSSITPNTNVVSSTSTITLTSSSSKIQIFNFPSSISANFTATIELPGTGVTAGSEFVFLFVNESIYNITVTLRSPNASSIWSVMMVANQFISASILVVKSDPTTSSHYAIDGRIGGAPMMPPGPQTNYTPIATLVNTSSTQTLFSKTLNTPTFITPVLGTPSSGTLNNCVGQVADLSIVAFGANTTRATGTGDFPFGVKLQRAVTFSSVTYRVSTADASGNLVVELRKNGVTVSGTSATITAANQVAGGTVSGTWAFSSGDVITVQITAVGTTPGKGLIADIAGLTT